MIAILGAGKMGEALMSGLLRAGIGPDEIVVTVRRRERGEGGGGRVEEPVGSAEGRAVEVGGEQVVAVLDGGQRLDRQFAQGGSLG